MQIESQWSIHRQAECGPAWLWGHFWSPFSLETQVMGSGPQSRWCGTQLFPCHGWELTPEREKIGLKFDSQSSLRNLTH